MYNPIILFAKRMFGLYGKNMVHGDRIHKFHFYLLRIIYFVTNDPSFEWRQTPYPTSTRFFIKMLVFPTKYKYPWWDKESRDAREPRTGIRNQLARIRLTERTQSTSLYEHNSILEDLQTFWLFFFSHSARQIPTRYLFWDPGSLTLQSVFVFFPRPWKFSIRTRSMDFIRSILFQPYKTFRVFEKSNQHFPHKHPSIRHKRFSTYSRVANEVGKREPIDTQKTTNNYSIDLKKKTFSDFHSR